MLIDKEVNITVNLKRKHRCKDVNIINIFVSMEKRSTRYARPSRASARNQWE